MATAPLSAEPFSAYPVWADRLAAFRGTSLQSAALHSIADEAFEKGEMDYYHAALSAGDGCPESLAELDELIAEDARIDSRMGFPADNYWRDSSHAIASGLAA